MKDLKLTYKQQIFCEEYCIDYNATRAYKVAYPNVKKDETARANGSRLLTNANIKDYISKIQSDISRTCGVSRIAIVNRLKSIGLGEDYETQKDLLKALEMLIKMLGYNEPEKLEIKSETIDIESLSNDDLIKRLELINKNKA